MSKRGGGFLPRSDLNNSTMRRPTRLNALAGDDWMENDDFLHEIEQKEKTASKFLNNNLDMNGTRSD